MGWGSEAAGMMKAERASRTGLRRLPLTIPIEKQRLTVARDGVADRELLITGDVGSQLGWRLSLADDGSDVVDRADQPVISPVEPDTLSSAQSANASTSMAAFDP